MNLFDRSLRVALAALTLTLVGLPGRAAAVNLDGRDGIYAMGAGIAEIGQSSRDSETGIGGEIGVGMPFGSRPGEALEFSLKSLSRDRDAGGSDDQHSLFVHWVRDIGGNWFARAVPFVLFGAGAIQEDVLGDDHVHFGFDGGLGALFPLGSSGLGLRTQATAQAQVNDESVPSEDLLIDFHLQLGLHIPLGGARHSGGRVPAPEYPPEAVCENRVVDPVTGRARCVNDSDRDGIPDGDDACPGTPAGTAVDGRGCKVKGVIDSDGDGVLDEIDACPDSPDGMQVDASGCLVDQTVTLRAVQFVSGSAQLTADARVALDSVARTLKSQPNLAVDIVGHTDSQGNDNFNLELSRQRAESVRQRLMARGIGGDRLSARGMGEAAPIADNASEAGRQQNRRVEFTVRVR